ncbi:MAG: hypothetical protein COW18_07100 [Zetaproteobacteria bacterium CG12_big_fil_rev_8_21_14_0_65_54_13]|nr:MAG: hypothetical protein COX55_03170 [Zetaproteobacteria bacterium CG23_combo_of_CG06-09_8_20_14_all_54_7]PIW48241.1 MAG: hypothetical protein COW18_07100 [Zetaproteobacteria bacterium CG12_big_fil_rev_8_21_14_0_65_54_13]
MRALPATGLALMLPLFLAGCSQPQVDVMFECASPSGSKVATLYRVASGDRPSDIQMKMNVRPATDSFDDSMQSFSFKHGYDAIMHWHSDHEMLVEYPQSSDITNQEPVIFGSSQTFDASDAITILYQEKPSTHGYFMVEKRCFSAPE